MNKDIAIPTGNGGWPLERYPPQSATAGQKVPEGNVLDFATFVRTLRRWRWLILGAAILGLACGLIGSLLTTPIYRAWVTLEVNPPTVEIMDEKSGDRAPTTSTWDFIATQVGLLGSNSLAERVAQDLKLANNAGFVDQSGDPSARLKAAAAKVRGGLNVITPEEGQLVKFSYDSESPQLSALVANGIADSFISANLERRYEASSYARNFLERQIANTRNDLERSERQLVAYAQQEGIINTTSGESGAPAGDASSPEGQSLMALNDALAAATARRVAAEGAYRQSSIGATSEVTASTQALRQQRAALEAEYQEKRTLMKPEHPDMLSLRSRINELDRQISKETSQVSAGRTNTLLAEYRAALSAERALQGRVAALKGSVLDLRGRSIRYTILQREVDTNRTLYDALLQRYKEVGVAGGVGTTPVSIVDRADPPWAPYKPNMPVNLALGLGLGLLGGIGTAVGLEFLNDTIKTREDVRSKLGLACLGAIPKKVGKGSFVEDLRDPGSMVSEAYSAVVAALRFATESGVPKTLLVTSAQPSEGKSSTALALAQNFARRGKSVLLVDADMRKPAFKTASEKVGVTQLLTTDEPIAEHVVPTQYEDLWLLPCGPLPPNPADLLSTGRFHQIIAESADKFELTIIDGPPTLGLADAPLLASMSANVLFVIESGKTRTSAAREALERLASSGARVLGAILTKATESGGYYGYRNYGYGYAQMQNQRSEILMIPHDAEE